MSTARSPRFEGDDDAIVTRVAFKGEDLGRADIDRPIGSDRQRRQVRVAMRKSPVMATKKSPPLV